MTRNELIGLIHKKESFLCVGLDTDITKIPTHLLDTEDPIFEFNKQIIDATKAYAIAYKPNSAFYETLGHKGWLALEKTTKYLKQHTDCFTIADAKRGDIGNTSHMYAKAFLEYFDFDSITVAPYMGEDSVTPFLTIPNKWVIVLGLTSNKGALDFQTLPLHSLTDQDKPALFEQVLKTSQKWGTADNMMYVIGATQASMMQRVRKIVPNHFLLVPGVGAQGGSLADVAKYGMNKDCGLIVNASRSILYASNGTDFAEAAAQEAATLQTEMKELLSVYMK